MAATLQQRLDQARSSAARLKAREDLKPFGRFHKIYLDLLIGSADPTVLLHLVGHETEGDYYALTEHGWQVLFLVDYERRLCIAVSLNRATKFQEAASHLAPRLP